MINEFIELSERKRGALMIEQETRGKFLIISNFIGEYIFTNHIKSKLKFSELKNTNLNQTINQSLS